jgi:hypothetical protein
MLADLRRLQSHLGTTLGTAEEEGATSFALVLVGPGLWSHYHSTPNGIQGEYHVNGPLAGQTVVLTHHSVLRALLKGNLTTEQATRLGLLAFSGHQSDTVRNAFERGFLSSI